MSKKSNLLGQQFGYLTVVSDFGRDRQQGILWQCRCTCGNVIITRGRNLQKWYTRSCGCYQKEQASKANVKNLTGQRFGRLFVMSRFGSTKNQNVIWLCQCECGNTKQVSSWLLTSNRTRSCGCLNKELSSQRTLQRNQQLHTVGKSKSGTLFLNKIEQSFGISIQREFCLESKLFDGRVANILFEVDNQYWHRNSKHNDALKDSIALRNGYAIVRCEVESTRVVDKVFSCYRLSIEKVLFLKGVI